MFKIRNKNTTSFVILLILTGVLSLGFIEGDKNGNGRLNKVYNNTEIKSSGAVGDAFRFHINNLNIPINSSGVIADVNLAPEGSEGKFGVASFLFSSGFMMSGLTNNSLWACAQATASRVQNFLPGPAGGNNDPRAQIYVLNREEGDFVKSWDDWKVAVELGADFYDGDGDGLYNPIDKNGNGVWDPDEDAPDLIGDQTAWCLYNDGVPAAQRERFSGIGPQGIEIRQTVFGYSSKGALGNILFVRYRLKNAGTVADRLDSVLFSVWADPDLGDFNDDLVGVNVPLNAGFTYQRTPDAEYGSNPPCFMIDFFSGPRAYIPGVTYIDNDGSGDYSTGDTPLDTAFSFRGLRLGVEESPGAMNLPISSFVHYQQSDPIVGDPNTEDEARGYMKGLTKNGDELDPCTWNLGNINFPGCATTDRRFWYSGDPVKGTGWLNTRATDQRQMTNTGPFTLNKDDEVEIVVAYVVGQGSGPLASITRAIEIDKGAQFIFDGNFRAPIPPPTIKPIIAEGADYIDFILPVSKQFSFSDRTDAWIDNFQGINIYAYKTNNTQDFIDGQENSKLFRQYQVQNFIKDLYKENADTRGIELLYPQTDSLYDLDKDVYSDSTTGRIRVRITQDPFTGDKIIKGKPYYFAFTSYAINYLSLVNKAAPNDSNAFGLPGDYYLSSAGFVTEVENNPTIITVVPGEDLYSPPVSVIPSNKIAGPSLGIVGYDIVDQSKLTNDDYQVTFFKDNASSDYKMFWKLENITKGSVLVDTGFNYQYGNDGFVADQVTDGFITKIEEQVADLAPSTYSPSANLWYKEFDTLQVTGVYYVGKDVPVGSNIESFPDKQSSYISADKLRKVEIRFGTTGKAYRFINGYKGVPLSNGYRFASAITATDTTNRGKISNWDEINNRANGFVDVPFTAWVADERYPSDKRQLAVGFVERRKTNTFPKANPDGIWDPSDSLLANGEVIVVFDADYDPTGSQIEITGGEFKDSSGNVISTVWSDLLRAQTGNNLPQIPANADVTDEQRSVFNSSWLNAMYVVGLEKVDANTFYKNGDILTLPLSVYPYTDQDIYRFKSSNVILSSDQKKALFDKVTVFPNPLFGYNVATSYTNGPPDEPFVTFSNLPEIVSIKIYSLSGQLLKELNQEDKSSPTSPFLPWDLQNESGLRVASGMYLAIVSSPEYGEKVLKFAVIMPQKQIPKY